MNSVRFFFSRSLRWPLLAALSLLAVIPAGAAPEALTDIAAGSANSTPQNLTELGGKVYFTAIVTGSPSRRQLFVYNPAAAAGSQITQLSTFAGAAATTTTPYLLRAVGTKLVMLADGSANGHELWVYDPANSSLTEMSINGTWATTSSSATAPSGFIVHNGKLYFSANHGYRDLSYTSSAMFASGVAGGTGSQLWVYDPAQAYQAGVNPKRLTNLNTVNPAGAQPSNLVAMGNYVFFSAYLSYYDNQWGIYGASGGGAYGPDDQELAMYNIATDTTTTYNLAQGSTSESFNGIGYTNQLDSGPLGVRTVVNDVLYFTANATDAPHGTSNVRGTVLMKFDPATMSAPAKAAEFNADSGTSAGGDAIGSMAVVGSIIYLSATNGSNGLELYYYNTSSGASGLVSDVYSGGNSGVAGTSLVALGGHVFFSADSGTGHGSELWAHTPATGVTAEVVDIYAGAFNSNASQLFTSQNKLYFRANEPTAGTELWMFDPGTWTATRMTDLTAGASLGTSYTLSNPSVTPSTSFPTALGFGTDVLLSGTNGTTGTELFHLGASAAAPAVTSLSPSSGPTAGGTSVTITGTDLTGATAVSFGGTAASSFTVVSGTSITATSPAASAGAVNVTVTTAGGTSATSSSTSFTYVAAPAINSTLTASGTYGSVLATYTIDATNSPTSFSASGLPAGLAVDTSTGAITGTPTAVGTFNVTVGATGPGGSGTATLVLTIAKASQTISWTAVADKTFGDAAFTVGATASSGLAVTYSVVAGNATISGHTVTLIGTGAVTLRAEQAGNSNYEAAVGANTGFMVAKATATVSLGSLAATYDGATKTASATTSPAGLTVNFTYDGSGTAPANAGSYAVVATISDANYQGTASGTLVVGKAAATVTLGALAATYDTASHAATATTSPTGLTVNFTYDGSSTAPTQAGSYAVVGTISHANYQGTASGTLVIGKATATVTLGSLAPTYNAAAQAATATTSPSGLIVGFTYDGGSTAPTNAGSYAVVGTINDNNYQGSASGTLAIAKAPLTVTAEAKTRAYGAAEPAFTGTLAGFMGSDTSAAVSGTATFTTDATVTSAVGSYTITPAAGTLSAANYSFTTFTPGVLAITKAPLTVTADAKGRSYGHSEPAFTATIAGFVNSETAAVVSGAPVLTTNALLASAVGDYTITPALGTLAATNYSFTFVPGTLTIAKAPLTVTANNAAKVYGAANPAFTASFSGFKNNETATVLTGAPALTTPADATSAVGSYAINAALGTLAATNYSFGFASGALSVTKAPLTVTADNLSRGYGSANPTFTAAVSGFVNGDTLNSATTGAPVLTSAATTTSAQGNYPIAVAAGTLAATNYDFTLVDGTLSVTQAVLTITADDKTKVYGGDNPALTYTITGFLNGDTAAVVSGVPQIATTASATSAAGTYDITLDPCGLAAANYIFNGVNGTLTVGKATLVVTADNATKVYGAANPTFAATLTGFVNNETLNTAGLTGAPALATPATAASAVNTYAITAAAGTLASANYTFSFVPGTLTVTKAPLTVTADPVSRAYGAANPAFTATLSGFVNSDTTASAVTGAAALTTTATSASAVNTYAIVPAAGTLASDNYTFSTFANGTLTVTKAPLTVAADAKSRVYGGANPALTATVTGFVNNETLATSGLAGTPALSTAAASGSNVGSYPIAVAVGSLTATNYAFATFTDGALTITKAPLTLTADAKSKVYGSANPTFTATLTGFVNGETLATAGLSGSAAFNSTATTASGVGSYPIAPAAGTLSAANYAFTTFVDGTLAVTKAPLTIAADNAARVYGAANPTFAATLTGFVNGETLATSGVSGTAALSTSAIPTSAVGSYVIVSALGTLAADNYSFATFVDGALAVTAAQLTVAADNQTKTYGTANPALSATISGFVNGDTLATAVTGAPALATAATAASAAGTYAITAATGTLASPNYSFAFAPGTLTVNKAVLTVTAENKSRVYLAAEPAFTAVIAGFAAGDTAATAITGAPAFTTTATTASGVGSYPITPVAGSLASANYTFTFAPGALTITPATAEVTLANLGQIYTGQPRAITATTTPSGLPVAIAYGGASSAPVNAGSYPVTATVSDPNYLGSANGVLVVGRASQSLSFGLSGSSLTVGASISLSATASSGLPVSFSLVSGNASLTGATLVVQDTSSVVVRATQAGSENFLPASAEQTLTGAAKRAQTISFPPLDEHAVEEGSIVLNATASSGLPVSFVVLNGPAIVQGNVLTFTGLSGTIAVGAVQSGDAVWAAAPSVQRTFEVTSSSPDVFFGQVGDGSNQKVGEVAAALPPKSNAGTLMVVAPALGVNAVLDFKLEPDGSFVSTVVVVTNDIAPVVDAATPPRAAATRTLTVRGRLMNGVLTGSIDELSLNFTSSVQPRAGTTSALAGYYESNSLNSASGSTASIVGPQGQMLVVATTPTMTTGATGTVDANGRFNVAAPGAMIRGSVDAPTTTVSGTIALTGQEPVSFSGLAQTTVRTDRLINLSSRVRVGPADGRTLITGFVIGGTASKRVLLRAIGPALSQFGVDGALGNPRLELYNAAGERVLDNDDWAGSDTAEAFAQVGAFGLSQGTRDAALLTTLAPGAYTMHVKDGGGSGIALAEIYDASTNPQTEYQRLINISSRGMVESGEGVLIGGFVVTGNAPKRVLVRGAGPVLGAFGVGGTLADPRLAIYRGDTVIAQNNDWGTPVAMNATQAVATAAEITIAAQNTGAFAFTAGSKDAAIVVTLAPGAYTAQVASADGGSGVGLVEIYEIPE